MLHSVSLYISIDGDISNVDMFEAAQNSLLLNAKKVLFPSRFVIQTFFVSETFLWNITLRLCRVKI